MLRIGFSSFLLVLVLISIIVLLFSGGVFVAIMKTLGIVLGAIFGPTKRRIPPPPPARAGAADAAGIGV